MNLLSFQLITKNIKFQPKKKKKYSKMYLYCMRQKIRMHKSKNLKRKLFTYNFLKKN